MKNKSLLFFATALIFITVSSVNAQSTLALQEKCAEQAKKYFFEGKSNFSYEDKDGYLFMNYQCHYSKKLDKCFILLITTEISKREDDPVLWIEDLYDIFEGKCYGSFFRTQYKNFNWPVKQCIVGDKICHSEAEFKVLIKPYMEE